MFLIKQELYFPPVQYAADDGLLAIGGDLSSERLLLAYKSGIFPWYGEENPILWWSPDPRFVLFPQDLKVSKSMQSVLRNRKWEVTVNECFTEVIQHCSEIHRPNQDGTWIQPEMMEAYEQLHTLGYAKSVEVWENEELIGGLYGVDLNNGVFCGESMFSLKDNASKYAFIKFVQKESYKLIDCQVYTAHLESLGAKEMPRSLFLEYLNRDV